MESYRNQSGVQQTDQQLDQYGNPVQTPAGVYGTGRGAPVIAEGGGLSGMLHRSGSSSSSEGDGLNGRRWKKKGITQKLKESCQVITRLGLPRLMMEKIKEKLPGGAHH